ncbi:MAG: hypothetical protein LBR22_07770 [Desulfovibrio sp.]|jgi:hypothetical protein|nr:hypothetical protein [Desulfovibrio sp.]
MLTRNALGNLLNRYRAVLKKCALLNIIGAIALGAVIATTPLVVYATQDSITQGTVVDGILDIGSDYNTEGAILETGGEISAGQLLNTQGSDDGLTINVVLEIINTGNFGDSLSSGKMTITGTNSEFILGDDGKNTIFKNSGDFIIGENGTANFKHGTVINTETGTIDVQTDGTLIIDRNIAGILNGKLFISGIMSIDDTSFTLDATKLSYAAGSESAEIGYITFNNGGGVSFQVQGDLTVSGGAIDLGEATNEIYAHS